MVSFPKGDWFDFWTGLKAPVIPPEPNIVKSPQRGRAPSSPYALQFIPCSTLCRCTCRGSCVLPLQPLIQSTDETPSGPLELRVYPGPQCNGSLYLDMATFPLSKGEFLRQTLSVTQMAIFLGVSFGAV